MAKTQKLLHHNLLSAFTLIELTIVIVVIGILAGLVSFSAVSIQKGSRDTTRDANVKIISAALEKYYRKNGEYPSVALMTSQDVTTIKQKLGIVSTTVLKLPQAADTVKNSIVTSDPSPTRILYAANTSDNTKNNQCQTDVNGYCDGFTLQYKKELDGSMVAAVSLHNTFTPVAGTASCVSGETQSGNTCTKTYAATLQQGTYSCPSGGTLSGSTCTDSYPATYSGGGYTCPSGGSLSGSSCTTSYSATYVSSSTYTCNSGDSLSGSTCTHTYTATQGQTTYSCPNGGSLSGSYCYTSATATTSYYCPHSADTYMSQWTCQHPRPGYGTQSGCQNAGYNWQSGSCYEYHSTSTGSTTYSCPSGYVYNSIDCSKGAVGTPGAYSCPSGGTLSGSTCYTTYSATLSSGSYYCPNGGSLSGNTCTYNAVQKYVCLSGGTLVGSYCYTNRLGGAPEQGCGSDYTVNGDCYSSRSSATLWPTCSYGGTISGSGTSAICTYSATLSSGSGYYYCPSGGSQSGSSCYTSYDASYSSPYYYCSGSGSLSGSTCTNSYSATLTSSYYYCADGGTLNNTTCTYTYTLP